MSALDAFHAPTRAWLEATFSAPTPAQLRGWPAIFAGRSTLLLAPTGSGKTLAAFLVAIDRLLFGPEPEKSRRCRVLYVSPLKALGVDVEKNLRGPLVGIMERAVAMGVPHRQLQIGVRSGDTPAKERARLGRSPPDILITTPESLYLLLTSQASENLRSVDTVIVDEIHSLVPTKRGVHLMLSLERLEALCGERSFQRVGLSATQRPLDEVARLLGGGKIDAGRFVPRPVEIVDAGKERALELSVEVPVEDLSRIGLPKGQGEPGDEKSIWPSIHPRLIELVKAHRTTMIFVNSRRLSERLAGALNDLAGEELVLAHHGSLAKDTRLEIEGRLKNGDLRGLVATSSLELGIDMGAVDLVIQVEAPPSIASGLQRIGRAGHSVGGVSKGIVFPKFRGDLLAAAAATMRMKEGLVEETFYPRNPLDVLAQVIVAIVAMQPTSVEALYDLVRGAAPYAELPRASFEGLLDLLSGRYATDDLADLRPRITWDRKAGIVEARQGARRIAVTNGGTIPDRGLFGVFLAGASEKQSRRVGELDEEMVFESRVGDVFLLGASSWRIEDISHDRVLVTPAPGQPGRMPFWRGDRPGRPTELGRAIGLLARNLLAEDEAEAISKLQSEHGFNHFAATNLIRYLHDEEDQVGAIPTDRTLVIERFVDEVGDWRVCLLSPLGARVHAPWATAVAERLGEGSSDLVWGDDGFVFRLKGSDAPPLAELFLPPSEEVEALVVAQLADTSLFAARFRENAARALLLPRKTPGRRTPLWAQRRRSADLLQVASKYPDFPIILETYRECLRDVFDLPGLIEVLRQIESHQIRVVVSDVRRPSPMAASLLFSYVANFLYEPDTPVAERRAQALTLDQGQLRALLGETELRKLLDPEAIVIHERRLQRLEPRIVRHADGVHDLLLQLGDLSREELAARADAPEAIPAMVEELLEKERILEATIAGEPRLIAAEDAGRYRDALGIVLPPGLPAAFTGVAPDALEQLFSRFGRTHGPFEPRALVERFGLPLAAVKVGAAAHLASGRWIEAELLPGGRTPELCDSEVLKSLRQQSLSRYRRQVEPVSAETLGRFLPEWHGLTAPRSGLDALLTAIEVLEGCPLIASTLETEVLPARIKKYTPGMLDELMTAGEVVWRGLEPIGGRDGRIGLWLTDHYPTVAPEPLLVEGELEARVEACLAKRGALFWSDLIAETKAFTPELANALWRLVWAGRISNDSLAPLRSLLVGAKSDARGRERRAFRSRRLAPPGTEGRWSSLPGAGAGSPTERQAALARQLLRRHGVLVKEAIAVEAIDGGFSAVYGVLKAMEEAGKIRRGYFIAGLGATQFALPGADDRLRALRATEDEKALVIAATDPASPYGAALPWPEREGARPQRSAGAQVILHRGHLIAYLGRTEKTLLTFLPDAEPERGLAATALAKTLAGLVERDHRRALLVSKIDGLEPHRSFLAPFLDRAGFSAQSRGFLRRRTVY